MKMLLISFFLLVATAAFSQEPTQQEPLIWYSDVEQAQQISNSINKPIFAFFTGSDWCGWCHKLQREVFAKDEFIQWAKQNVVLLELDFPRKKQLPEQVIQQNVQLQQVFNVSGFPTIWMFFLYKDAVEKKYTIQALGSLGYPGGAVLGREQDKFLEKANSLLAGKK